MTERDIRERTDSIWNTWKSKRYQERKLGWIELNKLVEFAFKTAKERGIDYQTLDMLSEIDSTLSYSENKQHLDEVLGISSGYTEEKVAGDIEEADAQIRQYLETMADERGLKIVSKDEAERLSRLEDAENKTIKALESQKLSKKQVEDLLTQLNEIKAENTRLKRDLAVKPPSEQLSFIILRTFQEGMATYRKGDILKLWKPDELVWAKEKTDQGYLKQYFPYGTPVIGELKEPTPSPQIALVPATEQNIRELAPVGFMWKIENLLEMLKTQGIDPESADQIISRLIKSGEYFEPRPGFIRTTETKVVTEPEPTPSPIPEVEVEEEEKPEIEVTQHPAEPETQPVDVSKFEDVWKTPEGRIPGPGAEDLPHVGDGETPLTKTDVDELRQIFRQMVEEKLRTVPMLFWNAVDEELSVLYNGKSTKQNATRVIAQLADRLISESEEEPQTFVLPRKKYSAARPESPLHYYSAKRGEEDEGFFEEDEGLRKRQTPKKTPSKKGVPWEQGARGLDSEEKQKLWDVFESQLTSQGVRSNLHHKEWREYSNRRFRSWGEAASELDRMIVAIINGEDYLREPDPEAWGTTQEQLKRAWEPKTSEKEKLDAMISRLAMCPNKARPETVEEIVEELHSRNVMLTEEEAKALIRKAWGLRNSKQELGITSYAAMTLVTKTYVEGLLAEKVED